MKCVIKVIALRCSDKARQSRTSSSRVVKAQRSDSALTFCLPALIELQAAAPRVTSQRVNQKTFDVEHNWKKWKGRHLSSSTTPLARRHVIITSPAPSAEAFPGNTQEGHYNALGVLQRRKVEAFSVMTHFHESV